MGLPSADPRTRSADPHPVTELQRNARLRDGVLTSRWHASRRRLAAVKLPSPFSDRRAASVA